jgi:glutamyl-tRNA synthetase
MTLKQEPPFSLSVTVISPLCFFIMVSTIVRDYLYFFFDELYNTIDKEFNFPDSLSREDIVEILEKYPFYYNENVGKEDWFKELKVFSENLGYSGNVKTYKKNPDLFKGYVGDIAMVLRIALTKKSNTPDLFEIIKVMGKRKFYERLKSACEELV